MTKKSCPGKAPISDPKSMLALILGFSGRCLSWAAGGPTGGGPLQRSGIREVGLPGRFRTPAQQYPLSLAASLMARRGADTLTLRTAVRPRSGGSNRAPLVQALGA